MRNACVWAESQSRELVSLVCTVILSWVTSSHVSGHLRIMSIFIKRFTVSETLHELLDGAQGFVIWNLQAFCPHARLHLANTSLRSTKHGVSTTSQDGSSQHTPGGLNHFTNIAEFPQPLNNDNDNLTFTCWLRRSHSCTRLHLRHLTIISFRAYHIGLLQFL